MDVLESPYTASASVHVSKKHAQISSVSLKVIIRKIQ